MSSKSVEGKENVYASYASDATPCGCTPSWTRVLEIRRKYSVRKSLGVGWTTPVRRRQHDDASTTTGRQPSRASTARGRGLR